MRKRIKNRKGSALALTIITFAVLMIFATATLGLMVTENKQSLYHQNKAQAYNIARSAADIVDSAIRIQLRKAYSSGDADEVNNYIKTKLEGLDVDLFTEDDIETFGADSIEARTSLINVDGSKLLAIDVKVNYKGVSESLRKIITSHLTVSSSDEGKFKHQGFPIVAIDAAWRKDKDGLSDLSKASGKNNKQYAEIVGENTIFKNAVIPEIEWDKDDVGSEIINPDISGSAIVNLKNSKILLTEDYQISSEVKELYVFGDLEISGKFETQGEMKVYVMGGLYINGSRSLKPVSRESEDIKFYIYYEDSNYVNDSLRVDNLHAEYETIADFYVQKGKTRIMFKKNIFTGNIFSNDPFMGSMGANGLPSSQNDCNVIISSDDSSNQISFYGSIWAPDSYVVMGGESVNGKNAIPQEGMILGRFIEIEGNNHKKNFDYLDTLLKNSEKGIEVPGEISPGTTVKVLRFNSYYVDIPK